jgi:hypothetical protein
MKHVEMVRSRKGPDDSRQVIVRTHDDVGMWTAGETGQELMAICGAGGSAKHETLSLAST